MSDQIGRNRFNFAKPAFFSIDAAFAFLILSIFFSSFLILSQAAAETSAFQSGSISGELFAIRFSSFVLEKASLQGEGGIGGYRIENELDLQKLYAFDLQDVRTFSGKRFMGIYLDQGESRLFFKESGDKNGEVFCAHRLVCLSGKIVSLRACVS